VFFSSGYAKVNVAPSSILSFAQSIVTPKCQAMGLPFLTTFHRFIEKWAFRSVQRAAAQKHVKAVGELKGVQCWKCCCVCTVRYVGVFPFTPYRAGRPTTLARDVYYLRFEARSFTSA